MASLSSVSHFLIALRGILGHTHTAPFILKVRGEKTEPGVRCMYADVSLAASLNALLKTKPSRLTRMLLKCQAAVWDVVGHLHYFCFSNNISLPRTNLCHRLMALVILA